MEKNYRVHTNLAKDTVLNVNLRQDFDFLEVLSLKLSQDDIYKKHTSNYGVIVGRVLANDAFGIPNVRVSVFVKVEDDESETIKNFYPYSTVTTQDDDNIRYNLLPDESNDDCYRVVGTFPSKCEVLDTDIQVEIFGKYWKYTTTTNQAGDYMIFGVPTGSQQVHVDIDLSDIGILSQKPRDLLYKGYNISQFDNANQFKSSTNLDNLTQILSQDKSVFVHSFWGDTDEDTVAITRCDIQVQYKFEPTCVFLGAIMSDNSSNAIGHNCDPSLKVGKNKQLITGEGTIEMIRKTVDGLVEEYQIQGNRLIDGNGVWCYQIPMNLDYIATDEYGNIIATEDPSKGIPTRTRVRFRISKDESSDEGFSRHTAKYLVPNNPILEETVTPSVENGTDVEKAYLFGSNTPEEHFRDLYWNRVYSVKNYIPRMQTRSGESTKNYTGIKTTNDTDTQNYAPFNKIKFSLPFAYVALCIAFEMVVYIVTVVNGLIYELVRKILCPHFLGITPWCIESVHCIPFSAGLSEDENVTYIPGCHCEKNSKACELTPCGEQGCTKNSSRQDLNDTIQQKLGQEYTVAQLDFYNDWLNGSLYMPLWYWKKQKKRTFLFGLFTKKGSNAYCKCSSDQTYSAVRLLYPCSLKVNNKFVYSKGNSGSKYHKDSENVSSVYSKKGVIKPVENKDGLTAYYYTSMIPSATQTNGKSSSDFSEIEGSANIIRTFATDIILLGSLSKFDSDGIPSLYEKLPSTSANIPMIASVKSYTNDDYSDDSLLDNGDDGIVITSGMDWERNGDETSPQYGKGLFMDLSCTSVSTKPKTCINVERLSELSVNLDMQYQMQYSNGSGRIDEGTMYSDGMVTKMELEDNDVRSMFASLNHIGFVPTNVSETKGSKIKTQVINPITGYYVNKFKFIYPTDFDGRLDREAGIYTSESTQVTYDYQDESYLLFRFGSTTRRFYEVSGNNYAFPLYNNSYYFYFGINAGNTAIDKFRNLYYATCVKDTKYPFTIEVEKRPNASCIESDAIDIYHSYIKVSMNDIQAPISYTLYKDGSPITGESNLNTMELIFGYSGNTVDENTPTDGMLYLHNTEDGTPKPSSKIDTLSNGTYVISITDANGNVNSETIDLNYAQIESNITVYDLGKKFIDETLTPMSSICESNFAGYGVIVFNSISVDNTVCEITKMEQISSYTGDATTNSNVIYKVEYSGTEISSSATVMLEALNITSETETNYCLCNKDKEGVTVPQLSQNEDGTWQINVYIPSTYRMTTTQVCHGVGSSENYTIRNITIANGEDFDARLNNVPLKFVIGKNGLTDNPLNYNKYFYSTSLADSVESESLRGWFECYDESMYSYPTIDSAHASIWKSIITTFDPGDIATYRQITAYKFNNLFKFTYGAHVDGGGNNAFSFKVNGGVSPILIRAMHPQYDEDPSSIVVFSTSSNVTVESSYPNIVSYNYSGASSTSFNPLYPSNYIERIGNYFAGFTRNGGIGNSFDDNQIQSIPSKANPYQNIKVGGSRTFVNYGDSMTDVFEQSDETYPYFRAMFIDRRLDYDLYILGSCNWAKDDIIDAETINASISGKFYNGIDMSYNDEHNIIDSTEQTDSEGNITAYTKNNNLEYSYDESNGTTIWNSKPKQRRRYYSATLNAYDIREWFWIGGSAPVLPDGIISRGEHSSEVNGGFSRENYPTVRIIDAYNIPMENECAISISNCNYKTTAYVNENNKIVAQAVNGTSESISININEPITLIKNSKDDYSYDALTSNTISMIHTCKGSENGEFAMYNICAYFLLNRITEDSQESIIWKPRLFKVDENGVSKIKELKKSSTDIWDLSAYTYTLSGIAKMSLSEEGYYHYSSGETISINDAFDTRQIYVLDGTNPILNDEGSVTGYENMQESSDLMNYTQGQIIADAYSASTSSRYLTIASPRRYYYSPSDNLTKKVDVMAFGPLIDIRPFKLSMVGEMSYLSGKTHVVCTISSASTYNQLLSTKKAKIYFTLSAKDVASASTLTELEKHTLTRSDDFTLDISFSGQMMSDGFHYGDKTYGWKLTYITLIGYPEEGIPYIFRFNLPYDKEIEPVITYVAPSNSGTGGASDHDGGDDKY